MKIYKILIGNLKIKDRNIPIKGMIKSESNEYYVIIPFNNKKMTQLITKSHLKDVKIIELEEMKEK